MRRKSELGRAEYVALMACITLCTALAIDIMLPAFAQFRQAFGLSSTSTVAASIVTWFFLGQMGQLLFGPLSDSVGRLGVMRTGFVLYILGCLLAALTSDLTWVFIGRFLTGLGASALSVGAQASIRDRFTGNEMARVLSLTQTIFLLVPIIAPFVGAALLHVASWRVVFLLPALLAVVIALWSIRLTESLPPGRRLPLDGTTLRASASGVVLNATFVRYTLVNVVLFAVFSSYVGSSERIIKEIFHAPGLFIWLFAATGVVMAGFTFANAQLVERFGTVRLVRWMTAAYLVVALVLVGTTVAAGGQPALVPTFVMIALLQGCNVVIFPNSFTLALSQLGATAGMAAAVAGALFFVVGSTIGSIINQALVGTITPLAAGYAGAGALALILVSTARNQPSQRAGSRPTSSAESISREG